MRANYDAFCFVQLIRVWYETHPDRLRVVHIGGYDGSWDMELVEMLRPIPVEVFSFEPHPANFALMKERFGNNPNLHAINYAIASRPGKRYLYGVDDTRNQGSSFVKGFNAQRGRIGVEALTLPNLCGTLNINRIDLLRMNCEGAELDILDGETDTVFLKRTMILNLCLHGKLPSLLDRPRVLKKQEITRHIMAQGFELRRGYDFRKVSHPPENHTWQVYVKEGVLAR